MIYDLRFAIYDWQSQIGDWRLAIGNLTRFACAALREHGTARPGNDGTRNKQHTMRLLGKEVARG